MKYKRLALLITGLTLTTVLRAAEFNHVLTDKSTLNFTYTQMGVPVEGHFSKFAVQLNFDPAKPNLAKAAFDLNLASIDAGSQEANDEVSGKNWFNIKEFPQARFVSASFKSLGGNRFEVNGKMSIKGHTKDVTAPFTFSPQGSNAIVEGAFVLKRADFAIGEGAWSDFDTVANAIQIQFHFLASAGK